MRGRVRRRETRDPGWAAGAGGPCYGGAQQQAADSSLWRLEAAAVGVALVAAAGCGGGGCGGGGCGGEAADPIALRAFRRSRRWPPPLRDARFR